MTVPLNTVLPDSFCTGIDSPVMELSSTEAFPFATLPSSGICSPAHTRIIVPMATSLTSTDLLVSAIKTVEGADTRRAKQRRKEVTVSYKNPVKRNLWSNTASLGSIRHPTRRSFARNSYHFRRCVKSPFNQKSKRLCCLILRRLCCPH